MQINHPTFLHIKIITSKVKLNANRLLIVLLCVDEQFYAKPNPPGSNVGWFSRFYFPFCMPEIIKIPLIF